MFATFRLQWKGAWRHSGLAKLSLVLRGNWHVYTMTLSLQHIPPQPYFAIWLCPSPLLPFRLRKSEAQSGLTNWWSWLAKSSQGKEWKKAKEEGRVGRRRGVRARIDYCSSPHLHGNRVLTLADFWEETSVSCITALAEKERESDGKMQTKKWPFITLHPSSFSFFYWVHADIFSWCSTFKFFLNLS